MIESLPDRFWSKVVVRQDGCWEWISAKAQGYGQFRVNGKLKRVHRLTFELAVCPIPSGLTIDHVCRNRACCNPAHLEAVSERENILRGTGPTAENARKRLCKYGHPFTIENTYWTPSGKRECQTCRQRLGRLRRARDRGLVA